MEEFSLINGHPKVNLGKKDKPKQTQLNTQKLLISDEVPIAHKSRIRDENTNLMVFKSEGQSFRKLFHLPEILSSNDLVIVNESATLPASLIGRNSRTLEAVEIRLAANIDQKLRSFKRWKAIIFKQTGNENTSSKSLELPTEEREEPSDLKESDIVLLSSTVGLKVLEIHDTFKRFITVEFVKVLKNGKWSSQPITADEVLGEIYRSGKLIRYSYIEEELSLWDHQTIFSTIPISVEPPSAALQLSWNLVKRLKDRNISVVSLLHSAGLSSTGSEELDAFFPLPEKYFISFSTIKNILETKRRGGKVVAVGTTVLRALESLFKELLLKRAENNVDEPMRKDDIIILLSDFLEQVDGSSSSTQVRVKLTDSKLQGIQIDSNGVFGTTRIKFQENSSFYLCDALLTGMHLPNSSHFSLIAGFSQDKDNLLKAYNKAMSLGYTWHEFGDLTLFLPK